MYLYDHLDREYDRKNLYLLEVAKLQDQIESAEGNEKVELKKKLNELIKNKTNHPYNKSLAEYKKGSLLLTIPHSWNKEHTPVT